MTVSQESAEQEIKHIRSLLSMRVDGLLISVYPPGEEYLLRLFRNQVIIPSTGIPHKAISVPGYIFIASFRVTSAKLKNVF